MSALIPLVNGRMLRHSLTSLAYEPLGWLLLVQTSSLDANCGASTEKASTENVSAVESATAVVMCGLACSVM